MAIEVEIPIYADEPSHFFAVGRRRNHADSARSGRRHFDGPHLHRNRHRLCRESLLQEVPRPARQRLPVPPPLLVRLRLHALSLLHQPVHPHPLPLISRHGTQEIPAKLSRTSDRSAIFPCGDLRAANHRFLLRLHDSQSPSNRDDQTLDADGRRSGHSQRCLTFLPEKLGLCSGAAARQRHSGKR